MRPILRSRSRCTPRCTIKEAHTQLVEAHSAVLSSGRAGSRHPPPSAIPSHHPSTQPSHLTSHQPSLAPSPHPTLRPSATPSSGPGGSHASHRFQHEAQLLRPPHHPHSLLRSESSRRPTVSSTRPMPPPRHSCATRLACANSSTLPTRKRRRGRALSTSWSRRRGGKSTR